MLENIKLLRMTLWNSLPTPFTCLAPMEDVTDSVFRRLVAQCSRPNVFFTEFMSADGFCSVGNENVVHRLKYTEEERPLIAQIWGNRPENYATTARQIAELGFDGIDINMGCPVPKIVKDGACSALIDNPGLAKELYQAAKENSCGLPVSIKTRLGFRNWKTESWAEFLLSLNPDALIIHGRIAKDLSKFPARWEEIGKVVKLRDLSGSQIPIIGNGDIKSHAQILNVHQTYGVDGVMIGRGVFHNLFIFKEIEELASLSALQKLELLKTHARLHKNFWLNQKPYKVLKKFFKIYVSGFYGAADLRALLMETNSYEELYQTIDEWNSVQKVT